MQLSATECVCISRSRSAVVYLLAIAWVLLPLVTYAQIVPTWREEYDKRLKYGDLVEPLKGEIFGEKVNLYDGTLSFSATDIAVPGNSAIAVSISRSYSDLSGSSIQNEFGNWTLDIPSLSGTYGDLEETAQGGYWTPSARCSTVSAPPTLDVWNYLHTQKIEFDPHTYWDGVRLTLPDGGGARDCWPVAAMPVSLFPRWGSQRLGTRSAAGSSHV